VSTFRHRGRKYPLRSGWPAALAVREHRVVYRGVGKPYYKPFVLHHGHTGELMECVVPLPDMVVFLPDGYDVPVRLPRCYVYVQGNLDGMNHGYET